jgi:polar amino acid transport system substrate-binding protein
MKRRIAYLLVLLGGAAILAGCGSTSDRPLQMTLAALNAKAQQTTTSSPPSSKRRCSDLTASLRPPAVMPAPGAMPKGSFMEKIKQRGYLIAGVNSGFLGFGYLNPSTGQIEGFEIDLAREVARAIFGDVKNRLQLRALTVTQRFPAVNRGDVDIVVDAVTITCPRRQQVDFSTVYYGAQQRVLVPTRSKAQSIQDLGGKRVCASAQSTPIAVIKQQPSHPIAVGEPQAIDCLVALQQGRVDAISTDDSILLGFKAQDPYTRIVGPSLAKVPYGMAISKANPEFVSFVNGVLAKVRADGTWRRLYAHWVGKLANTKTPAPPIAQYEPAAQYEH